jgi:hypothetical protein
MISAVIARPSAGGALSTSSAEAKPADCRAGYGSQDSPYLF